MTYLFLDWKAIRYGRIPEEDSSMCC